MADIYEEIVQLRREGGTGALVTLIARSGSAPMAENAKMLVLGSGRCVGTVGGGALESRLRQTALEVIQSDEPASLSFDISEDADATLGMVCGGRVEFYVEPVSPPPEVLIVGAGHVGRALACVLAPMDLKVMVTDDRPELLEPSRLHGARLVPATSMEEAFRQCDPGPRSYVVIATRSHEMDYEALRLALQSQAPYVGLLGSAKKAAAMASRLREQGITDLSRLRCPVGLPIGGQDPAEIAVSIAADIVAHRRRAVTAGAPAST